MQDVFLKKPLCRSSFQIVGHANIVPFMLSASALDPANLAAMSSEYNRKDTLYLMAREREAGYRSQDLVVGY